MTQALIELDWLDLGWTMLLLGLAIALAFWQQVGLASQLAWAGGRSLLQLLVVGYFLALIFAINQPIAVLAVLAIMLSIAAIVAKNRISQKQKGLLPLVWVSLLISTLLTLGYAILVIIRPAQWFAPQYLIPLAGMVLGNSMNSASLAGERLRSLIQQNRREIETHLCLGATAKQAIAGYQKTAIHASLIPTLNQMMVVGIVSLPGMFTGQVLAGIDPLNAASYQILILFMIAFANLVTAILVTEGLYRHFFNDQMQLVNQDF